jgi:hypothetical protein
MSDRPDAGTATLRSRLAVLGAAAVLGIAVAACAQAGGTPQPVATSLPPSVAPTAAPTAEPPAQTPLNPAPAQMISRWTSDVATVDITATKLAISEVDFPTSMRLEVVGQELVLSHGSLCGDEGRYRWSIEGDTLRLEPIGPDPCDRRQPYFDGVTYTRVPG